MTTTRNTTSHANCTHEATKAARARCRAGKAQQPATVRVAKAQAETLPAPRRIREIVWERVTCTRCGGSGRYPSACWQGVCLGCSGKGEKLTRAGAAAMKKFEAYIAAHHTKMMIDLEPGDIVRDRGRKLTVVSVDPEIRHTGLTKIGVEGTDSFITYANLTITVNFKREGLITGPYVPAVLHPRGDDMQAALRHVANLKGAIVHYYDES